MHAPYEDDTTTYYAHVKKEDGSIQVGCRVCEYKADYRVTIDGRNLVKLVDLDWTEFNVLVFEDDDGKQVGQYSEAEAPLAEQQYWDARILVDVKRTIERTPSSRYNWVSEDEF